MELLYLIIWLVVGLSAAFCLIYLGLLFASLKKAADEILPVIDKVEETVDLVNEQLRHTENAIEKLEEITGKITRAVNALREALGSPVGKLLNLTGGARKAISMIVKGK